MPGRTTKPNGKLPYVTREGMEIQVKDAIARKPGAALKVDDIVDDWIVTELEKEGFVAKLYKQ